MAQARARAFCCRAGGVVPQSAIVKGAKLAWKTTWMAMMQELAPQEDGG
jgi:hypothetical protein